MPEVNLNRLSPKVQPIVRMALDLHWSPRQIKNGGVILVAPDRPTVKIEVPPVRQWNEARLHSMWRKVIKYSRGVDILSLRTALDNDERSVELAKDSQVDRGLMLEAIYDAANEIEADTGVDLSEAVADAETALGVVDVTPTIVMGPQEKWISQIEKEIERGIVVNPRKREPKIVSEAPWMARKGSLGPDGGKVYPSEAVIERTYDDHSKDYVCAWPGCDYTSPHPRSVANHFGRTRDHDLGRAAAQGPTMMDPEYTEPVFPDRSVKARIARLEKEIATAMLALHEQAFDPRQNIKIEPRQLAHLLAEQMVKFREENRQTADDHTGEPLTPEQILHRVRALVDDGTYIHALNQVAEIRLERDVALEEARKERAELLATLEQQRIELAAATAQGDAAAAAVAEIEAQRDRYRDRWTGLRAIVDSEKD